ncbi:DNA replication/repair protein RecF [soil metagenome]
MKLERLHLEQFRQYLRADIEFPGQGLAIFGANASGKSTILEAVALISTTKSPRTSVDREMMRWESGQEFGLPPFARVSGSVTQAEGRAEIEIGMAIEHADSTSIKKQLKLNGRPVRASTIVGQLRSVLFTPEDVSLVSGPPSERRRYIDLALCQIDSHYMRALSTYSRVLTQRNSLLKRFARDNVNPRDPSVAIELKFWDDQLVQAGGTIIARRYETIALLNALAAGEYGRLDGGELALRYIPALGDSTPTGRDAVTVDATAFALRDALERRRSDEVRRGVTLSGPHRDDVAIDIEGRDAGAFASRGQQRLAVLAIKLGEAMLMSEAGGDAPVVMLDDILSELDERHRALVLETAIGLQSQLLITGTDRSLLDAPIVRDLERRRTDSGQLHPDGVF